ncbi:MAG: hypothetical protein ACRD4X_16845 [Candidatus Acidiferrales bacterium]
MLAPRLLVCIVVCSLFSVSLYAQQSAPTSATSDPQAVAFVQKSLAALTGGASVTDVTLTGTARRTAGSDDESGTATVEATSTGDSRVELSFGSGNRVEIRNHSATPLPVNLPSGATLPAAATQPQPVGAWSGPDGVFHATSGQNMLTDPTWFFPALTLARLASSPV